MYVSDCFCVKSPSPQPKWLIDQTYLVDVGASELVWWAQVRLVPIHIFRHGNHIPRFWWIQVGCSYKCGLWWKSVDWKWLNMFIDLQQIHMNTTFDFHFTCFQPLFNVPETNIRHLEGCTDLRWAHHPCLSIFQAWLSCEVVAPKKESLAEAEASYQGAVICHQHTDFQRAIPTWDVPGWIVVVFLLYVKRWICEPHGFAM